MSARRLSFIGYGNMGSALVKGAMLNPETAKSWELKVYTRRPSGLILPDGASFIGSPQEAAAWGQYVLPAVKPAQMEGALASIRDELRGKVLISIAAGLGIERIRAMLGGVCPVVRVMPNTPAEVGFGMFGICLDDETLSDEDKAGVLDFFGRSGRVYVLPEGKFNAFSAVAGCGPAFVCYMMEGMVEAAVTLGFARKEALDMALALFDGTVRLADQRGVSPAVLREEVCSPGGMTIYGTNYLDQAAVRGHIVNCVMAAFNRGNML